MAVLKILDYRLVITKGNCSYKFSTRPGEMSPWIPVSKADFTVVALIFGTNNAYHDTANEAFLAGPGNQSFNQEEASPSMLKSIKQFKKNLPTTKTKNK